MGFSNLLLSPTVLTTGLDLLDLSEPVSQSQTKAKKSESSSKTSSLKKKADGSDLISAEAEQRAQALRGPETSSLDLGKACSRCGLPLSCQPSSRWLSNSEHGSGDDKVLPGSCEGCVWVAMGAQLHNPDVDLFMYVFLPMGWACGGCQASLQAQELKLQKNMDLAL